jgi:hypothetical protein
LVTFITVGATACVETRGGSTASFV